MPVLLGLLTIREAVEFIIYDEVAGVDLRTRVFFRLPGTVGDIDVAVEIIKIQRFRTPQATVVEFTRPRRAYNFERKPQVIGKLS